MRFGRHRQSSAVSGAANPNSLRTNGFTPGRPYTSEEVAANASKVFFDVPADKHRLTAADIDIRDDFVGPHYGAVTPGGRQAMDLLARTEGILLDPAYTAKAMAGLIDLIRQGEIGKDEIVVFLHTGGAVGLFGYVSAFEQPGQ